MALIKKKDKKPKSSGKLKISVTNNGSEYTFLLDGRLDTLTAPDLDAAIKEVLGDAEKLVFDLEKLEYISSAGLRVLLGAVQAMDGKGGMVVRNVDPSVREVFDLTGFNLIFNIE